MVRGEIRNEFKCKGCGAWIPKYNQRTQYCHKCKFNGTMHSMESKGRKLRGLKFIKI